MGIASGRSLLRWLDRLPVAARGGGVTLALFVLACVGAVEIVTTGRIFAGLRAWLLRGRTAPLGRLVSCPMCLGWWVGGVWSALGLFPVVAPRAVVILAGACASSGACWSVHVVLVRLGAREL